MNNIHYENIKDEKLLVEKIMGLETFAKQELVKNKSIYIEDLFFYSAIDKSLKLIDSFLFALSKRNLTVLAALARIQLDCVLRTYALSLVKDSTKFCEDVLYKKRQINEIKCSDGNKLSDNYICKSLGAVLDLDIQNLYQKISGFVHLSAESFINIAKVEAEKYLQVLVSKGNLPDNAKHYERLSLELANHFYYFGRILIEFIFCSWLRQKEKNKL